MSFLKSIPTTTNLLESLNDCTLSLSNRKSVLIAYVDSQKAFDSVISVSHPKLLHKLSGCGIYGNLLFCIFCAFLTGRLQQVKVGSKLSGSGPVTSGVPQGSVVGSLLFNLFINDITDHLDPTVTSKLYADDIKIYTELKNQNSTVNFQTHLIVSANGRFVGNSQLHMQNAICFVLTVRTQPMFVVRSSYANK